MFKCCSHERPLCAAASLRSKMLLSLCPNTYRIVPPASQWVHLFPQRRRRRLQQDPVCAQCSVVGLHCSACTLVCTVRRRAVAAFTALCCTCLMPTNWDETPKEVAELNRMSFKWNFQAVLCNGSYSWSRSRGGVLFLNYSMNRSRQTCCYRTQTSDSFALSAARSYFEIKATWRESERWWSGWVNTVNQIYMFYTWLIKRPQFELETSFQSSTYDLSYVELQQWIHSSIIFPDKRVKIGWFQLLKWEYFLVSSLLW